VRLRALAPAKVNLCLFLGGVRTDGRHELVTLFESLSLVDELEMTVGDEPAGTPDRVLCPDVEGENLVARALAALRELGWDAPNATVSILKRIPIAGGMAGGSADAAAALRLAVAVSPELAPVVGEVAAGLGADVPSQLRPGPAIGTGAGDVVSSLQPLAEHALVILPSAEQLPTAAVYGEADGLALPRSAWALSELERSLRASALPDSRLPDELLVNDLSPAAVSLCPSIRDAQADAAAAGASPVLVCGSGPTVVGLFWGQGARVRAAAAARTLAPRHPGALAATPVAPGFGAAEWL
jgi:4-diphosphocytidyl-2-C-methyl-D-erythritol kinase